MTIDDHLPKHKNGLCSKDCNWMIIGYPASGMEASCEFVKRKLKVSKRNRFICDCCSHDVEIEGNGFEL